MLFKILVLITIVFNVGNHSRAQETISKVSYGNNPSVGSYLNVGTATIYYEVYGQGRPIVLLHGGVYGYIDEFEQIIQKLAMQYKVICIATRGHGKSYAGTEPYSYEQRASDAYKVIRSLTTDSVTVLGFSDGGYSAFKLAVLHPEIVNKLIVIGAGNMPANARGQQFNYNRAQLMKDAPEFFKSRLALMPEPQNWDVVLSRLNELYNKSSIGTETFSLIRCPTLIMAGDRDQYISADAVVAAKKLIKNAQLSIIPGCGHVVFHCNFPAVWEALKPFIEKKR